MKKVLRLRHSFDARWVARGLAVIALVSPITPAIGKDLNLSDRPLFSGGNVKPNIMVAVDNSGSMDFETLFPTESGLLHWIDSSRSAWQNGNYAQSGNLSYAYLFPNGYNDCSTNGANCNSRDRRIYSNYGAVPPVPGLGFARSSDFNSAYFNPAVTYDPWIGESDATPSNAYYDPQVRSATLDLTTARESTANGETFTFRPGMVIPAGVKYYHTTTAPQDTTVSNVCYRSKTDYYNPNILELIFRYCRSGYDFRSEAIVSGSGTATGFYAERNDMTINSVAEYAVSYYPATFYLRQNTSLPADFGWSASANRIPGRGPNGEALYGYEIKRDNFTSAGAYNRALQNFANWFTYYRKRHLATRGGIAAAFDQINGARVGSCTINNPTSLTMRDLDDDNQRQTFYDQIFGIDFSAARGTPNRQALKFLGEQLETNPNIITSSCQQNFALLFTDGYNTDSVNGIGNADQGSRARRTFGDPFGDNYSNTIADVAMKYYENLGKVPNENRRDIERNRVPTPLGCDDDPPDPWLDCEDDLHMVTFGVTLGQRGLIFGNKSQYGAQNDDPYRNPPDWSLLDLSDRSFGITEIDDLWHATINSRGTLLNANTPQEIASAFSTALEEILNASGSESAVSANSRSVSSDTVIFQASFTGGSWEGDLAAYAVNNGQIGTTPLWSAADTLVDGSDSNASIANNRRIVASVPRGSGNNISYTPYAFRPTVLQSILGGLTALLGDPLTADQINHIRGNRRLENSNGGYLRSRGGTVLGDIVHSSPLYVGAPDRIRYPNVWRDLHLGRQAAAFPENNAGAYSDAGNPNAFAQANASRKPMVYAGANDGMLHAFDASDGTEQFAFIPGGVFDNLSDLTDTDYQHKYYVDGTPAAGDVVFNNAWHTVLVGGLGNGGRSLYALDITDPGKFGDVESKPSSLMLWEYSHPKLGRTFGQPSIVRLHNGRWAAMAGNGYNSDDGSASLFLIDIQSGQLITNGPIDTNAKPTNNGSMLANGLSEPFAVDVDRDFITDYAYAGDLYGNVWRFDLTSKNPSEWSVSKLFTTKSRNGNAQPITTQPQVGLHSFGNNYGVMVYFGTGKYLENGDAVLNTDIRNSFYGVWDVGTFNFAPGNRWTPSKIGNLTRSSLTQQDVLSQTVDSGDATYRLVTDNPVIYQQSDDAKDVGTRGWVLDLPASTGELIVSNAALEGETVSFSTTVPDVQACTTEGSGFFMKVKASTGGRTDFVTFDLNGDRQYTQLGDSVKLSNGTNAVVSGVAIKGGAPGAAVYLNDSFQMGDTVVVGSSDRSRHLINLYSGGAADGRRTWREIRR